MDANTPLPAVRRPRRRRVLIWSAVSLAIILVALLALTTMFVPISSDTVRARTVAFLADKLDSDVELGALSLRTWPGLHIDASSLLIRQKGHPGEPPLIAIRNFSVDANAMDLWHKRVTHVRLEGLTINIVPHKGEDKNANSSTETAGASAAQGGYIIDRLESSDAQLVIIPSEKDKAPKVWAIHQLRMQDVSIGNAMPFQATLTNAIPPGEIETAGTFGPWHTGDPGQTPLQGTFAFNHADLGVFHGIAGTLHSKGTFGRTLDHIDVNGETDTPDFTIKVSGHPFPLHTKYHAIVDGTNGDTILEKIDAQFLQSFMVAKGKVVGGSDQQPGRTVTLDVVMDHARIEDVMVMAVRTPKPPLTGTLKMHTSFLLPPGDADVIDRLRLNGKFFMTNARFTRIDVQKKINELSHRGRGQTDDEKTVGVVSNFQGEFRLSQGQLALPTFAFAVPGATVKLAGHYALKAETVDFRGDLLMDAKISQTQSGLKRLLFKVVDPIFTKDGGGSALPIKITGKRDAPDVGLDLGRVFHRGP